MIKFAILKNEKFIITIKEDLEEIQILFHNLLSMKPSHETTRYEEYQLIKFEILEGN